MLRDGGRAHSCSALQEALDLRLIRSYVFDMNGIFHTPKRFALLLLAAFALANGPVWAAPTPVADKVGDKKEEAVWGEMPAGAKTTYIGIHGGTVPVSLLTAGDGSPMIALVGLTGSDFLNFLRTNDRLQDDPPRGGRSIPFPLFFIRLRLYVAGEELPRASLPFSRPFFMETA